MVMIFAALVVEATTKTQHGFQSPKELIVLSPSALDVARHSALIANELLLTTTVDART